MTERVYTRDRSSGRVHRRIRDGDRLLADERCNSDQAGTYDVIRDLKGVPLTSLCGHCFPDRGYNDSGGPDR